MKLKRFAAFALTVLLMGTFVAGCAVNANEDSETPTKAEVLSQSEQTDEPVPEPEPMDEPIDGTAPAPDRPAVAPFQSSLVSRYPVEAAALLKPKYGEEDAAARTVASGANRFALRLSSALAPQAPDVNFVCSPYSVWLPLAALLNATDHAHRETMLAALGAEGVTEADVNRAASRMLYDLTKERDREYGRADPLHIANAVFVDKNATLDREFAQEFLDCFRGQALNVDFSSSEAVKEVNRWASENTEGLITDIIQEFLPGTDAAIANAIYFSDRWDWEFDPAKTASGVFHTPGGDVSAMFMQREGDGLFYYEDDRLQAVGLPFEAGGEMYFLLPEDGDASGLLATLDESYFQTILSDGSQRTGKLLLPRFRIESDIIPLNAALSSLGVPLFDANAAPLNSLLEGNTPVYLSSAVQKAVIEVDEKGTTAAAVTIMIMTGGGPIPTEPFEMICDKPFVFLLCDHTYDGGSQILFTGVVNRPEQ